MAPALLIQFLREHRSEWAELDVCTDIAAALGHGSSFVSRRGNSYCGSAPLLLAHSFEKQEVRHIAIPTVYMIYTSCIYCLWEGVHTEACYVWLYFTVARAFTDGKSWPFPGWKHIHKRALPFASMRPLAYYCD